MRALKRLRPALRRMVLILAVVATSCALFAPRITCGVAQDECDMAVASARMLVGSLGGYSAIDVQPCLPRGGPPATCDSFITVVLSIGGGGQPTSLIVRKATWSACVVTRTDNGSTCEINRGP